jgi:2-iminobutanoate/2-iminopropanoate deaminase
MVATAIRSEALAPASGPYASGFKVSLAGGDILFISGQVAESPDDVCVARGDVTGQAEQALKNMVAVLEAAGGRITDVAKVTVFLRNMEDRDAVAEVRRRFFGDHMPASTLVEVSKLARPDWLIEVEACAVIGRNRQGSDRSE